MELDETKIQSLIKFFQDYLPQVPRRQLEYILRKHIEYKTCYSLFDHNNEPVAFVRWNVINEGKEAYVMDMVIRPEYRNNGMIHNMLVKSLAMYPTVEYITFERQRKVNKKPRTYRVEQLLRKNAKNI